MRKKIIGISLVILLLFLLVPSSFAVSTIKASINGKFINFDQPPVIINGRTLVPIRAISENLGSKVSWNPETQTVIIFRNNGGQIQIGIGKTSAIVDGSTIKIDVPARIINGRTMVPLRFIGEGLGIKVDWVASTNTVVMVSDSKMVPTADSLVTIDNQIKQAKIDYDNASLKYGQLLKDYTPYSITGEIKSTGDNFIIVYGSAIGSGIGLGKGYIKVLNPEKSGITLYIYTGINFYVGNETDSTYGDISVFDNGPAELQTAKKAMNDAKALVDKLTNDRNILVEKINGIKEIKYQNGDYYKGTVDNTGAQHGNGIYKWTNGDVYTGSWVHGQRTGKGKYVWPNGDEYEGDFINGVFDGEGVLKTGFHKEGTLLGSYVPEYYFNEYTGHFKEGFYSGQGTLIHKPDPLSYAAKTDFPFKYIGEFNNDKFEGYGTLYDYDGNVVSNGVWKNGDLVEGALDENALKGSWINSDSSYKSIVQIAFLRDNKCYLQFDNTYNATGKIDSITKDGNVMIFNLIFEDLDWRLKENHDVIDVEQWKSINILFIDKDNIKVINKENEEFYFVKRQS